MREEVFVSGVVGVWFGGDIDDECEGFIFCRWINVDKWLKLFFCYVKCVLYE